MTKILKPVCLTVILALVLSLGTVLVPGAGVTPTVLASPDGTVIQVAFGPDGDADWETAPVKSGSYSVSLAGGTGAGASYGQVWMPFSMPLASITGISFWHYLSSTVQADYSAWPVYKQEGETYTDNTGYMTPYVILEISDGTTTHWIVSQPSARDPDSGWTAGWEQWDISDNAAEYPPASGMDPTQALWHDELWTDNGGTGGSGAYPAGWEYLSYFQTLYSGYNVVKLKLAMGWWAFTANQTAYVDDITVNTTTYGLEPLEADFSAEPTAGAAPLKVKFEDESTGDIVGWSWNFGDGKTSDDPNPSHTYTQGGVYTVSLTVTEALGGTETEKKVDYINVLVADFYGQPVAGDAPLTVQFTNLSKGDTDSWWWSFGDGGTSRARHPVYTYNVEGIFDVTLTVSGSGRDTEYKSAYIIVEAMAVPARLSVRNLEVTPVYAQPRQAVAVNANVVNEGGTWGSQAVNLVINGQFEQSADAGISPGTAQPVSFTVYKVEPGTYQVDIGGATGTFYVMEEAAAPAPKTGLLAGGELDQTGIIAIVVIGFIILGGIVAAVLLARRV